MSIRKIFILPAILLGMIITDAQTINVQKISPKTVINVVRRVEQEYYLLTKNIPVEFTVTGPTTIRVYTRLLWQNGMDATQTYKIIARQNDIDKILTLESQESKSAVGAKNQTYGKWRSFYLDVPAGVVNYKFTLLDARSDTVAVRFTFEKPKEYKRINATGTYEELQFVENEKNTSFYQLKLDQPVKVKIVGPVDLKAVCRLNYDYTMEGKQSFTITANNQGKKLEEKEFTVIKSETGMYKNMPELIPSTPRNFYLSIPSGTFTIEFSLQGTLAKTAGINFYTKPLDSYE